MADRERTNPVEPYSGIARLLLIAQLALGIIVVFLWLWTGVATFPKSFGGPWYEFDRVIRPISYWGLVIGVACALIALPLMMLLRGVRSLL